MSSGKEKKCTLPLQPIGLLCDDSAIITEAGGASVTIPNTWSLVGLMDVPVPHTPPARVEGSEVPNAENSFLPYTPFHQYTAHSNPISEPAPGEFLSFSPHLKSLTSQVLSWCKEYH